MMEQQAAADRASDPSIDHRSWQHQRPTLGFRAAAFWLKFLFWSARHAPWLVRGTRTFWIWAAWIFSPALRRHTMANGRRLLGARTPARRLRRFGRRVLYSFYDFVYDIGSSRTMSLEQLHARIESIEGTEHFDAARRLGRGLIVATAHLGSFEVGVAALRARAPRVHIVFHRDRLEGFNIVRHELHQRLGVMEARVDDGWSVWMELRDALRRDEVVLMQADRLMPGQSGRPASFADGHVMLPLGPLKLSQLTGAPILPVFTIRQPSGKVRLVVEPLIDPEETPPAPSAGKDTTPFMQLARTLERQITAHPEQWLMIQPAFLEDLESSA